MMPVLLSLFLLTLLTACADKQTVYVKTPSTPLPASLLADYPIPIIPDPLLWGQCLTLNAQLLETLGEANRDKADIRKAEETRK